MNFYFSAHSGEDLKTVCRRLELAFGLPPFTFDSHDHWEYGVSEKPGLRLNVTKTDDDRTIETWMPGCPSHTNYQLILTADAEPSGFSSQIGTILGTDVVRYA